MRTWVRRILGALLALAGLIWLLQGVRVLPGSFMTGSTTWTLIGAACILAGASLALRVRR